MREIIEYLSAILNIKTGSELVIVDMSEEIEKVNDISTYRRYIKENLKHIDLDYLTGFQKFILLTDKYLKQQEDAILESKFEQGEIYAKALTSKVKKCRNFIEDKNISFAMIRGENQTEYFKDHELRMLKKIGSELTIIEYSRTNRLSREVYKEYVKAVRVKHHPELLTTDKRVSAMIKGVTK